MLRSLLHPSLFCLALISLGNSNAKAQLELTTQANQVTAELNSESVTVFELQFTKNPDGSFTIDSYATVNLYAKHPLLVWIDHVRLKQDGVAFFGPANSGVTSNQSWYIVDQPIPTSPGLYSLELSGSVNSVSSETASLKVCHTVKGDADLDGDVDFNDFLILTTNYLEDGTWTRGDFNQNGVVDFADFSALSSNFGFGT